jgi:predicted DNA-binding protein with PD1-like motif
MKYSQAKQGRVFVLRLEDGDVLHQTVEKFAREKGIGAASLIVVGGADAGSRLVVGPLTDGPPMQHVLEEVHEVAGTGTLFPDDRGEPVLHMHLACGRKEQTITGCAREGVKTWHIMEVILFELLDCRAVRLPDKATGFKLLQPDPGPRG